MKGDKKMKNCMPGYEEVCCTAYYMKRAEDAKFAGKPALNSDNVPEQFEEVESFLRTCERTNRFFYLCGIAEGRVLDKFIKNEDPITLSDFLEGMKKFHELVRLADLNEIENTYTVFLQ